MLSTAALVKFSTWSKPALRKNPKLRMNIVIIGVTKAGKIIFVIVCHRFAPSISAASYKV